MAVRVNGSAITEELLDNAVARREDIPAPARGMYLLNPTAREIADVVSRFPRGLRGIVTRTGNVVLFAKTGSTHRDIVRTLRSIPEFSWLGEAPLGKRGELEYFLRIKQEAGQTFVLGDEYLGNPEFSGIEDSEAVAKYARMASEKAPRLKIDASRVSASAA